MMQVWFCRERWLTVWLIAFVASSLVAAGCGGGGGVQPNDGLPQPLAPIKLSNLPPMTFRNELLAQLKRVRELLRIGARTNGGLPKTPPITLDFGEFQQVSQESYVWSAFTNTGTTAEKVWVAAFRDKSGQVTGIAGTPYIVVGLINQAGVSPFAMLLPTSVIMDPIIGLISVTFRLSNTGLSRVVGESNSLSFLVQEQSKPKPFNPDLHLPPDCKFLRPAGNLDDLDDAVEFVIDAIDDVDDVFPCVHHLHLSRPWTQ